MHVYIWDHGHLHEFAVSSSSCDVNLDTVTCKVNATAIYLEQQVNAYDA